MEEQYLTLLRELVNVSESGDMKLGRNGYTAEVIGSVLRCNLAEGFPALTTKRVFLRGVKEELKFFLNGETNTKILEAKGVDIWRANTEANDGEMGPMYGAIWRHATANSSRGICEVDQLARVMRQLREEPESRRILMTSFSPALADEGVLWPCHGISIQFLSTQKAESRFLTCMTHQRSADVFLGLPFNIASYAFLTHALAEYAGMEVGELIITIGSAHLYGEHLDAARIQLSREPRKLPTYHPTNLGDYWDEETRDVVTSRDSPMIEVGRERLFIGEVVGYDPHPAIKAPMIV